MKKEYIYPSVRVLQLRNFAEPILAASPLEPETGANDDLGDPTLNGEDTRTDQTIEAGSGDAI